MRTRIAAVLLALALTGCADNVAPGSAPGPAPSSADVIVRPQPSAGPSTAPGGKPAAGGSQTISGQVTEGVEPNCLILQDSTGSHLLVFDDPAKRAAAKVGAQVTLVGRSDPRLMSTCQQGIPFIVTSVTAD